MPITNIQRVKSIVVPLPANDSTIISIYQNPGIAVGDELQPGYKVIGFNCFIKNLKAFAKITSVAEAPLPDIQLEDTSAQKVYKVLDIEWKSARKQMNLFVSNSNNWSQVGSVSMLNPAGYPFRIYNLMDLFTDNLALELGDNSKIGAQIQDVGYGLLTNQDSVVIHGSYTEEIFLESKEASINISVSGGGNVTPTPATPDYSINNSSAIGNSFLIGN